MNQTTSPAVILVNYGEDLLASLADRIIEQNLPRLPDLSQAVVLLPNLHSATALRRTLLKNAKQRGVQALLGPRITTLQGWLDRQVSLPQTRITPQRRLLMLTEVLLDHSHLYGKGSPWALAENLAELFDELTLHQTGLPGDYAEFVQLLRSAYRAGTPAAEAMGREATLVHTLWHAWHRQLQADGVVEPSTAHILKLAAYTDNRSAADLYFYIAGFHHLSPAEAEWVENLLEKGQACLVIQGAHHPGCEDAGCHPDAALEGMPGLPHATPSNASPREEDPAGAFFDTVFARQGPPLRERALEFASRYPRSPVADHLHLFAAAGADEEARAIEIQIRRWLLDDCRRIAIVTENRRLARQVRALLEQAGVQIADSAGWALSTTSAAAALERWLQTVEEQFDQQPLLDLLKSPFVFTRQERQQLNETIYRLEHHIIHGGNVARGLERYRQQVEKRRHALGGWTEQQSEEILDLLGRVEQAATPLLNRLEGRHRPSLYIAALQESMERLGMSETLAGDDAGSLLLRQIGTLADAAADSGMEIGWKEFRAWLGHTLESSHFCPTVAGSQVQLMNLTLSNPGHFDALIIAGLEREHLPGAMTPSPFFNNAVRIELGLSDLRQRLTERLYLFRRLLQAAPRLLLTLRREQDGEEILPTPWLESLRAFHRLAYSQDLDDNGLSRLVHDPRTEVFRCDTRTLPRMVQRPAPTVPPQLPPRTITASGYQQLVECPYHYFAARCLQLAAPEAIRETLAKSDYGERVHRCLEAFHRDLSGLPGPFSLPLEPSSRQEAIQLMEQIAEKVFAADLEDNFQHRGWLLQWKEIIPGYIDWQIQRAACYRVERVELACEVEGFLPSVTLRGRIDRIDLNGEGAAVVDYKTGSFASREEILQGESVQLPFYALLLGIDRTNRCEYLQLDRKGVRSQCLIQQEELRELARQNSERLKTVLEAIHDGAGLPAFGDENCCSRCAMSGVCRRQCWMESVPDDGINN